MLTHVFVQSRDYLVTVKQRLMLRTRFRKAWPDIRRRVARLFSVECYCDLYWDLKFGGYAGWLRPTLNRDLGAHNTQTVGYTHITEIFHKSEVVINNTDVLVDVGCGYGRIINWWLREGYRNKIVGIELDEDVASVTRRRLGRFANVTIIAGDAVECLPEDGTIFYLFNPFHEPVMRRFKQRLEELFDHRRNVTLIYNQCRHVDVFQNDRRWLIKEVGRVRSAPVAVLRLWKSPI